MENKIENWKKEHGEVYLYEVDGKRCYLHAPTRAALSAAAIIGGEDPMKYNEILLDNCWIEGDEEIRRNDGLFIGVSNVLKELVNVRQGAIKKL